MKFWQILGNVVGVVATVVSGGTALPITAPFLTFVNGVALWEAQAYDSQGNYINPTIINIDEVDVGKLNATDIIMADNLDDIAVNLTDDDTSNDKPWHLPFVENYAQTDFDGDGLIGRPPSERENKDQNLFKYGAIGLALLLISNT